MSKLLLKRFWPFGVILIFCSFICMAFAGTSRGSVAYSRSARANSANSYPDYGGFMKRSGQSGVEAQGDLDGQYATAPAIRRSVHDQDGRTLIFKSLIMAPLAMVLFILLAVLLLPIPVISSPLGRSMTSSIPYNTIMKAREILTAEECVERISCELSRISRSYDYTSWIPSTLERLLVKNKWSEKIIRGLKGTSNPTCYQFSCSPSRAALARTLNLKDDSLKM